MPSLFVAASVLKACCILSLSDLKDTIRYVDREQGFFISATDRKYTWGFALSPPPSRLGDVPQVSGQIRDCSNGAFTCLQIAYLKFVRPRRATNVQTYRDGAEIRFQLNKDGSMSASATCYELSREGCVDNGRHTAPVIRYDYRLSSHNTVTGFTLIHAATHGSRESRQRLRLESKIGFRL